VRLNIIANTSEQIRRNAPKHSNHEILYTKSNEMSIHFAFPLPLLSKTIHAVKAAGGSSPELQLCREMIDALLCYDAIARNSCFHARASVQTLAAVNMIASKTFKPSQLSTLIKGAFKHEANHPPWRNDQKVHWEAHVWEFFVFGNKKKQ
jgi:hypothetical protein